MTDYPVSQNKNKSSWRKLESKKKWNSIFLTLIFIVIFFAIINAVVKSTSFLSKFSGPNWDGESSFAVIINSNPMAVAVYQKEPKRIAYINLSGETYVESEGVQVKLKDLQNKSDPENLTDSVSQYLGAKVSNWITIKSEKGEEKDKLKVIDDFNSYITPVEILFFGKKNIYSTNITRLDALRLWWQSKGIGTSNVDMLDLTEAASEKDKEQTKVLGAGTDRVSRQIESYFLNQKVLEENMDIEILDATGEDADVFDVKEYIERVGGRVVSVSDTGQKEGCTLVSGEDSYTLSYLANLFECDIKSPQPPQNESKIVLILGSY